MSTEIVVEPSEGPIESSQTPQSNGRKRKRVGPYRGQNRALKYVKLRRSQPQRLPVCIPEQWCAAVGERARQFVAECSQWVKEICPLNVEKWDKMPDDVIDRLYGKIKSKYELPEGGHVERALKKQCSGLYRKWRERLKRKHFFNNSSLRDIEQSCPSDIDKEQWRWLVYNYWSCPKQRKRSEKNRVNASLMKIRSFTGSKSIARVVHEIGAEEENNETSSSDATTSQIDQPKYIRLWITTKGDKNGVLKEEGEIILEKFKELHSKVVDEKGVDDLTIEDAYEMVLGHSSGYARGLGRGHIVPSKKERIGRLEIEQLKEREKEMRSEMERELREAREREQELRVEIEKQEEEAREREAELRAEIESNKQEALEREEKLRADLKAEMLQLFSKFAGVNANNS